MRPARTRSARAGRGIFVGPLPRRLAAASILVGIAVLLAPAVWAQERSGVLVAPVSGIITPVISDHLREGIEIAERDGRAAFLVELDTPGGLDTSMREIIQAFLASRVPVIVYVAPQGARAASAGAFITMAAHVAAMAPGTAVGASTPVDLQGGDISDKIINDAAAYAEAIARARGRNVEVAIDMVREGRSVSVEQAVELDVVDLIASSRAALLEAIDGRKVRLSTGEEVTLATRGAETVLYELRGFRRVLQWLADPNIAFMFLSIGTLAIIYEVANPGVGAGGIVGVIMLILALFALSVLPVNAVGVILIVLAAALFIGEVFTPGVGVFAAGGTVSLLVGGLFLFRGSVGVDPFVLVPIGAAVGGSSLFIGRMAWRTRNVEPMTGIEAMIGATGVVGSAKGKTGQVLVNGTWWKARSDGRPLKAGKRVKVLAVEGLELVVEVEEEAKS
ncbi:MAG: nodulation protein NfeD [Actinomycetota bacterium]